MGYVIQMTHKDSNAQPSRLYAASEPVGTTLEDGIEVENRETFITEDLDEARKCAFPNVAGANAVLALLQADTGNIDYAVIEVPDPAGLRRCSGGAA